MIWWAVGAHGCVGSLLITSFACFFLRCRTFFFVFNTRGKTALHTHITIFFIINSIQKEFDFGFISSKWFGVRMAKVKYYHQALIAKRLNRFPLYMACVFILWCKHNGIFGRCWMESTQKAKVPSSSSSFLQWITLLFFSVFRERFSLSPPFRRTARFHHHIHPKKEQRHKTFAFRFCAVLSGKHFN